MQTSDPDVYAVGECAEHDGHVYGLVAPGLEQAAVAAAHIAGENPSYRGSAPTTKLKVVGTDVFSMGDVEQLDQRSDIRTVVWRDPVEAVYRRLVIRRGRLVGALGVGEWPDVNRIQQAVRDRASDLAVASAAVRAHRPALSSEQADVGDALAGGGDGLQLHRRHARPARRGHRAGRRLDRSADARDQRQHRLRHLPAAAAGTRRRAGHARPMFGARTIRSPRCIAALIALAAILLPAWPYSPSVEAGIGLDRLWISGTWKQVTGFTLVALSLLVALLSVRKRIGWNWLGGYRVVAHRSRAGRRGGARRALPAHRLQSRQQPQSLADDDVPGARRRRQRDRRSSPRASTRCLPGQAVAARRPLVWLHILAFWPLPLLLMLHVVTVYAY